MTEAFLGGVAALRIYRYKGQGPPNVVSGWHNPWGYGLYFTEDRLIGVSYTKYLSHTYIPAWILSLVWVALLISEIAWARMTNSVDAPLWFPPLVLGLGGASLAFLLYLSPRLASTQIGRLMVSSIRDVENLPKDVVLPKSDISMVRFQRTRIRDPGRGLVQGSMFTVTMKAGQTVIFVNTLDREKSGRLLQLFQDFTSRDPSIHFVVK